MRSLPARLSTKAPLRKSQGGPASYLYLAVFVFIVFCLVCCAILLNITLTRYAYQSTVNEGTVLASGIGKYIQNDFQQAEQAARMLAGSPWIHPLLRERSPENQEHADSVLDRYARFQPFTVTYLMDTSGQTISSSNRMAPDSFVGHNYAFRSYFKEAMNGQCGRYFGLGATSRKRGYYVSVPVYGERKDILGVVVVKKGLGSLETYLSMASLCFITDARGVVIMSSDPQFRLQPLWPLLEEDKASYAEFMDPSRVCSVLAHEVSQGDQISFGEKEFIVVRRPVGLLGWSIVLFRPTTLMRTYQFLGNWLTSLLILLITGVFCVIASMKKHTWIVQMNEFRFRQLFDHMSSGVAVYEVIGDGDDFVFRDFNTSAERINRINRSAVIGRAAREVFPGIEEFGLLEVFKRVARTGNPEYLPATFYHDERFSGWLANYVYKLPTGEIVAVHDDVTERKRNEDILRESEERFRGVFESSAIGMTLTSPEGEFVRVNRFFAELVGYPKDELQGKMVRDITHPEDISHDTSTRQEMLAGIKQSALFEKRYYHRDGSVVWAMLSVTLVRNAAGKPLYFISQSQDITSRKRYESELKEARDLIEHIVEVTPSAVFVVDTRKHILRWNKKCEELTGYSATEAIGQPCSTFADNPCKDRCGLCDERIAKPIVNAECTIKRKDGAIRTISKNADILRDAQGVVIGGIECFEDITERRRAEKTLQDTKEALVQQTWGLSKANEAMKLLYKELEAKNRELQRLDQLKSDFVSTVSHELRTPLAIIKEGVSLITDKILGEVAPQQMDTLSSVLRNINRLTKIINDLLDISKLEAGKIQLERYDVDLAMLITDVVNDFRIKTTAKGVSLVTSIPPDVPFGFADRDRLVQILTNLIANAAKFTPAQGTITVAVKDADSFLQVTVADTGPGIAEEDMPKLFTKFQQFSRVHGPGEKGTGLGLAISKMLVELHGGTMWVESEQGRGSAFHFTVPKCKSQEEMCLLMINENLERVARNEAGRLSPTAVILVVIANYAELVNTYSALGAERVIAVLKNIIAGFITRTGDTIAACYDGKTVVVLPRTDIIGARAICSKIQTAVMESWVAYQEQKMDIRIRYGIAIAPKDGRDARALIDFAGRQVARRRRILIIDDEKPFVQILSQRLEKTFDVECTAVYDGQEGVSMAQRLLPDVVVCDMVLPQMNGYEVIGRLKGEEATKDIPVIMMTAYDLSDERIQQFSQSSVPVLSKAAGNDQLMLLLTKYV